MGDNDFIFIERKKFNSCIKCLSEGAKENIKDKQTYNVLTNNCEHNARYIRDGKKYQTKENYKWPGAIIVGILLGIFGIKSISN